MKRTGKIARLPYSTRQELNRRLLDNEPGDPLIDWLNGRPEVQLVLREQFEGIPITKQNLSEWRTGGFAMWELRQEIFGDALEAEEGADELDAVTHSRLTDSLCTVLAGRYASLLVRWDGEVTPAITQKLRVLHILCRDVITLRRCAQDTRKARMMAEQDEVAGGVATARRHREAYSPKNAPESDPVKASRTTFTPKSEAGMPAGVATSGRHPEGGTGKVEGSMMNDELGKRAGTSDQSKVVAPDGSNGASDIVTSVLEEVAAGGRQPGPLTKPLPGLPNSYLSKALKAAREEAAREKNLSGQPVLTVLPDWAEAVLVSQPGVSLYRK